MSLSETEQSWEAWHSKQIVLEKFDTDVLNHDVSSLKNNSTHWQ